MDSLNATGKLFGEIIALRIVVQRTIAQLAALVGPFDTIMKFEHEQALADLSGFIINDDRPERAAAIRMHAERVIDSIYTDIKLGRRPT